MKERKNGRDLELGIWDLGLEVRLRGFAEGEREREREKRVHHRGIFKNALQKYKRERKEEKIGDTR